MACSDRSEKDKETGLSSADDSSFSVGETSFDDAFFSNKTCRFFPCHEGIPEYEFNCLFCFCPLYLMEDRCGGAFFYNDEGLKDCSRCTLPHKRDSRNEICARLFPGRNMKWYGNETENGPC